MSKRAILDEIKRLAVAAGGKPLGEVAFRKETGIQKSTWWPHYWVNWGDALVEAGYPRNAFVTAIDEKVLLEYYAKLVKELGHPPVHGELGRQKQIDPSFPSDKVFLRFGSKDKLVQAVLAFCESQSDYGDVIDICRRYLDDSGQRRPRATKTKTEVPLGYVYLIKSGRHHKIGRTNSIGRREWELGIKIPIPPKTIHYIKTDDPVGVERYWHERFAAKRGEGEWFDLSPEDVTAFKRWKQIS